MVWLGTQPDCTPGRTSSQALTAPRMTPPLKVTATMDVPSETGADVEGASSGIEPLGGIVWPLRSGFSLGGISTCLRYFIKSSAGQLGKCSGDLALCVSFFEFLFGECVQGVRSFSPNEGTRPTEETE